MPRHVRALTFSLLALLLAACGAKYPDSSSSGSTGGSSGSSSGTTGSSGSTGGTGCSGVAPAKLEDIFPTLMAASAPTGCAAAACHGGGQGGLKFTNAHELWAAAVNVASTEQPSKLRVVPNDAEASFLFQRLNGTVTPTMPSGGPAFTPQQLALVAGWICSGAPEPAQVIIDGINPTSGVVGSPVKIVGTGFSPDPSQDVVTFTGSVTAGVGLASATELDVTVPAGAQTGPITVAVGGVSGTSPDFTVNTSNPVPTLSSVSPDPLSAAIDQTITLTGTGFVGGSVAQVGGTNLATTYVSDTSITAQLPASAVPAAGSYAFTVTSPSPGGGTSAQVTVTAQNPTPTIAAIAPTSVIAGAGDTSIALTGTGFLGSSQVSFDAVSLPASFGDGGTLDATVPAANLTPGTHQVVVTNPSPGGGASAPATFTVNNPAPTLSSISPTTVATNGAAFTLTVTGSGFNATSVVNLGTTALTTTLVSSTTLTAQVPTITSAGSYDITVVNPSPGGGTSSTATLTANTVAGPTITGVNPSPGPANQAFPLTVSGSGYVCSGTGASTVSFNGASLAPASCSTTSLGVSVPATAAGSYTVTVQNGSTASNAMSYALVAPNPVPTLSTLSPSSAIVGSAGATLTATGTNFVSGATLFFNGSSHTTTFVSATQVTADLSSADLATVGSYAVTVNNPAPGGGASNAINFDVINVPTPVLSSISPTSALAGSAITLIANGSAFQTSSQIVVNGTARTTSYVSANQLTAALSATDLASAGTYTVAVTTPGGGTSATQNLTVDNPAPTLSSISPSTVAVGAGAVTITATGTNFVTASVVNIDGSPRTTAFVSSTQLTATLTSADDGAAGTHTVTVVTPGPGGGTSTGVTLTAQVQNPVPSVSTLSPCGAVAGSGTFTLTINGSSFVSGATVSFNGTSLTPSAVSSSQLTVSVPGTAIATAPSNDAAAVTVTNPGPGGGAAPTVYFGVAKASQTLSTIQNTIFTPSCATSGCHVTGSATAPMSLQSGQSYGSLVGVQSANCAPTLRVLACGPLRSQSVLVDKILATAQSPACSGSPMPKAAPITAAQKQAIVDWVAEGAPNN